MQTKTRKALVILLIPLVLLAAGCGGGGSTNVTKIASQRFISLADDAAGYQKIFNRPPTAAQESLITANLSKASSSGLTVLRSASAGSAAGQFENLYSSSTADVITLIGHNSSGSFRFADGSTTQLGQLGSNNRPVLAVISCESGAYVQGMAVGIPTELTYDVAFRTEELFLQRFNALPADARSTPETIQIELEAALATAALEKNLHNMRKYSLIGAGTGVVGVSIYQVGQ